MESDLNECGIEKKATKHRNNPTMKDSKDYLRIKFELQESLSGKVKVRDNLREIGISGERFF